VYIGLALLVISCIGWATYDEIYLSRLKRKAAAVEIYRRLRRYGKLLRVDTLPGETPFEFAEGLCTQVNEIIPGGLKGFTGSEISTRIQTITGELVRLAYRPAQVQAETESLVVYQWKVLRWHLRWIRVLISWRELQHLFVRRQAGLSRNSSDVTN